MQGAFTSKAGELFITRSAWPEDALPIIAFRQAMAGLHAGRRGKLCLLVSPIGVERLLIAGTDLRMG